MSHLAAALDYLAKGHHPIPCYGKKPIVEWKTYQTTAPTVDQVTRWWTDNRNANIALVLGRGIWALDVDGPEGHEALAAAGVKFPETTPMSMTGRGVHYFFRGEQADAVGVRPHVDVRGKGIVIVPPSVHENGRHYQWLQSLDTIAPAPASLLAILASPESTAGGPRIASNGTIPEGYRDTFIYKSIRSQLAQGMPVEAVRQSAYALADNCEPKVPHSEVDRKLDHCLKEGHRQDFKHLGKVEPVKELPVRRKLSELNDKPIECLIEGLIPEGMFGLLSGQDSMGKTLLAMEIAKSVLLGEKLFGEFPVKRGTVLGIFLDDPENLTQDRLKALGLWGVDGLTLLTQDDFDMSNPMEVVSTIERIAMEDRPSVMCMVSSPATPRGFLSATSRTASHASRGPTTPTLVVCPLLKLGDTGTRPYMIDTWAKRRRSNRQYSVSRVSVVPATSTQVERMIPHRSICIRSGGQSRVMISTPCPLGHSA